MTTLTKKNTPSPSVSFVRRHRTFFAGLFVLIPAVVIPVVLIYSLMKAEFIQGWCHLHVTVDNAYGLLKGSPVTISGMSIGHVEEVVLHHEGKIGIKFKIQRSYNYLVKQDTRARIQQKSPVVGEWIIELTGGSDSAKNAVENDTLVAIMPFRFDNTIQQVTSVIANIESLVTGITQGRGSIGQILVKDTLAGLVNKIGRDVSTMIGSAGSTMHNVDSLLGELTLLGKNGNGMIDSFSFVAAEVRTSLAQVVAILENVKDASGHVEPLLEDVRFEIGEADRMMRSLQQSWIYRQIDGGKRDDPMLKEAP